METREWWDSKAKKVDFIPYSPATRRKKKKKERKRNRPESLYLESGQREGKSSIKGALCRRGVGKSLLSNRPSERRRGGNRKGGWGKDKSRGKKEWKKDPDHKEQNLSRNCEEGGKNGKRRAQTD